MLIIYEFFKKDLFWISNFIDLASNANKLLPSYLNTSIVFIKYRQLYSSK